MTTSKLLAGETIVGGRYRVEKIVNDTGWCEVARVVHEQLGQRMSLRFLRDSSVRGVEERLRVEGKRRAGLPSSPHLAPLVDVGELEGGRTYLAAPWIEGWDLVALLKQRTRLLPQEACDVVAQMSAALSVLHDASVFHEDLKPSKVVVGMVQTGEVRVTLLDTGLRMPMVGGLLARYMSPEQIRGEPLDVRSNVWTLGVILYELLTGTPPFTGDSVGELLAAHEQPLMPLWAPPALVDAVRRWLSPNPAHRVPDALTLARVLAPMSAQKTTKASPR